MVATVSFSETLYSWCHVDTFWIRPSSLITDPNSPSMPARYSVIVCRQLKKMRTSADDSHDGIRVLPEVPSW